jgi:polyisoprenoid-binding protein YceI
MKLHQHRTTRALTIRRWLPTTLLAASLLTGAVLAASQNYSALNPSSSVEFNFFVTLIPVPGKVNGLSADLNFDSSNLAKTSGTIKVKLAKLDTGIALRDEHARGYLGVDKHPNAIFTLNHIEGVKALEAGKESTGIAVGSFDLNGIQHALKAPITLKLEGQRINVSTQFNVTLADHKIEIFGADPKVDVTVKFALEAKK